MALQRFRRGRSRARVRRAGGQPGAGRGRDAELVPEALQGHLSPRKARPDPVPLVMRPPAPRRPQGPRPHDPRRALGEHGEVFDLHDRQASEQDTSKCTSPLPDSLVIGTGAACTPLHRQRPRSKDPQCPLLEAGHWLSKRTLHDEHGNSTQQSSTRTPATGSAPPRQRARWHGESRPAGEQRAPGGPRAPPTGHTARALVLFAPGALVRALTWSRCRSPAPAKGHEKQAPPARLCPARRRERHQ